MLSRQHADCTAWGERITLHRSLSQGNIISKDRGRSNWFSATESGEQDTGWQDANRLFLGDSVVIRYRLSLLSNMECSCIERFILFGGQNEQTNK